jgi:hypothetical protein
VREKEVKALGVLAYFNRKELAPNPTTVPKTRIALKTPTPLMHQSSQEPAQTIDFENSSTISDRIINVV